MRQHFRFTTSDNLIGWRVTRQILDYKNWDSAKTMFCRKHAIPGLQSIYMFLCFPRPFQISFLSISLFVSLACPRRFLFFVLLKFSCSSVSSHFPFLYNVLVHKPFSVHFQVFEYVMTSSFPFLVLVVTAFPLSSACPLHLFFPNDPVYVPCSSLSIPNLRFLPLTLPSRRLFFLFLLRQTSNNLSSKHCQTSDHTRKHPPQLFNNVALQRVPISRRDK